MTVRVGEQRRSFVGCRRLFVGCRRLLVVVVLSSFVGLFFVRWLSVVVVVRRLRRSLFVVRCSLFVVRYCRLSPFVRSLFIVDYLFVCLWLLLLSPSSIVVVHCRRPWSSSNVVVQCRRRCGRHCPLSRVAVAVVVASLIAAAVFSSVACVTRSCSGRRSNARDAVPIKYLAGRGSCRNCLDQGSWMWSQANQLSLSATS